MFLVGLTGGIATGKSTTADIFKEHNIPLIDADVIARSIVKPGETAWQEIRDAFGAEVFQENGELDRDALGKIIFNDVKKRVILNKITHPKIQRKMLWSIIEHVFQGHQFVVLDIPLLFETQSMLPFIYKIITVSCNHETQVRRLMDRNGYTESEAEQRIKAQLKLEEKCEKSDFVIDNSATVEETKNQTENILKYLKSSNHHIVNRFYLFIVLAFFWGIFGVIMKFTLF